MMLQARLRSLQLIAALTPMPTLGGLELEDDVVDCERLAGCLGNVAHHCVARRPQDVLHLHRLDDRDLLARDDLVALAHRKREEDTRHGAHDAVGQAVHGRFGHVVRETRLRRRVYRQLELGATVLQHKAEQLAVYQLHRQVAHAAVP
eukprot:CAMPEP_0119417178 /NCGR_PEP_ID=MMETSP1335-20130426/15117_1 /TAXON_ID=259385 /ORGANISM="Chrysoculter rhomboideus, Strain RCC1486" /LENGTH=147 /DNA_ID=CAMNT_0007442339 /DNA_START=154 /DNA_END=594 /DNA_ORIENTATION=+